MMLFRPLRIEDAVMQPNIFGSPANWHIAHVTWFFQKVLDKHGTPPEIGDALNVQYLNSYYQRFGRILPKSERGRYPRPTVDQTLEYRSIIDRNISALLTSFGIDGPVHSKNESDELSYDIILAMQHEMQHQELMVYDFQNYFERFIDTQDNYMPEIRHPPPELPLTNIQNLKEMVDVPGGLYELGYSGKDFCYDNEMPEHKVYLEPFQIDVAPVTNSDFASFIDAGAYDDYKYWLADGWELVQQEGLKAPLYWKKQDGQWIKKDLRGVHKIEPNEPVVNVSFFEADAYAKWAGKRLPTEAEWEKAASWNETAGEKTIFPWGNELPTSSHANLLDSYIWRPAKIGSYPSGVSHFGCHQMIGDVWEWTSSEYVLYPGFSPRFPEYTDKWAINQKVLRGGSFATPARQIRNSYRNYFKPHERILFAGFRCARDKR